MAGFSSEEILDLLYKKVAFGANKSGRSEQFTPAGETSSSFIAVKPSSIWREANVTNVPVVPPSTTSSYVQVYASHTGSQPGSTTPVATCTPNSDAPAMPGQTLFKRSWKTGATNWLGPTFGAGYLVKVYVGPANWDGDTGDSNITQVIFGSNANRDWYFDYEAGMLYWTPENENGDGSFEDSDSWTTFTDSHVVYIAGYRYIGATGAGGTSDITGGASTIATSNLTANLALLSNSDGKVAVSAVTNTELGFLSGVTSAIQTQLAAIQTDVDGNESDSDTAIAAVASDLSDYESSNDAALAALQSDVDGNESDADAAIALKLALAGGTMTGNITFSGTQTVDGRDLSVDGAKLDLIEDEATADQTQADINALAITTVGVLSSGSISSDFGNIDNGTSTLSTGAATVASLTLGSHTIDDIDITNEFVDDDAHIMSSKAIGARFALINADTTGTASNVTGTVAIANGGTGATDASGARTNLGLAIGSNVQAHDNGLDSIAGLTTAADKMIFTTGSDTYSVTALSSFARTILDDGDAATVRATIGAGTSNFDGVYGSLSSLPTLGTIASQAADGVDIDGGAIDDTAIGATAASTGAFTTITASGDVTIAGNLNVIGSGSYINLQQENVYMKDALVTLGFVDDDDNADADFTDGTAAGSDVGIEAYKQGVSNTSPTLVYAISPNYWAIDNKDHAASALTRVARTFKVAHTITTAQISAGLFTVTHNLNHEDLIVQVRDNSTDQEVIFFKYKTKTANTIEISVGSNFSNGDVVNVVVVG